MTEQHECEWFITSDIETRIEEVLCDVGDCPKVLSIEEADRRLNEYEKLKRATEALTAVASFQYAAYLNGDKRLLLDYPALGEIAKSLRAYADALAS